MKLKIYGGNVMFLVREISGEFKKLRSLFSGSEVFFKKIANYGQFFR